MARLGNLQTLTAPLKQRNFAWYISGGTIALFGIWAQRLTIAYLTWEITESPTWLGFMVAADLFPTVIFTPIAGVVADRVDRRIMSIITQALGMLQALALAVLAYLNLLNIWILLGLTLFIGIVWAFNTAARLTLVPNLMEPQHVPSAIALDSAIFNLARFIGPALAGYLIDTFGAATTFALNTVTFAIFIYTLYKCRLVRDERRGVESHGVYAEALDGFRYAVNHSGIGPMLILVTAVALGIKPALELLAGVNGAVYNLTAIGLGWLMSASSVGAIIAAIWLAQRGTARGLTRFVIANLIFSAISIFVFTATGYYVLGLIGVFLIGAATVIGGTATQTLMQNAVDGSMRGRVMSIYGMIYRGVPALGALAMGYAAEFVGFQLSLATGGLICLVAFFWILRREEIVTSALEFPASKKDV